MLEDILNCLLFGLFVLGCEKGEWAREKPITFCVDPETGIITYKPTKTGGFLNNLFMFSVNHECLDVENSDI